jgi:hypothetical protein
MTVELLAIDANDISSAWAKAYLKLVARGVTEIAPLIVTVNISAADDFERPEIRHALDSYLDKLKASGSEKFSKLQSVHTVANTIFPQSLWNPGSEDDAGKLFERFEKAWPRIKRCPQNYRGSYFRRLTAFRPKEGSPPVNQLKHIIETYKAGNHRRSALQASVFDPALDHSNSHRLPFPCLHQVAFAPTASGGLAVTGFYATQYVIDRAYGNFLGLCRLGHFMASQLGLQLARMTCVASVAQLGTPNKTELGELTDAVQTLIADVAGSTA